ncbi:MAG TPA: O-antigen ligase family protein [Allosphingosinicella sp.]|jgi:O-antigen ligase|nr:O-antigen ligase family protein [Allosphingosinicella sp.]
MQRVSSTGAATFWVARALLFLLIFSLGFPRVGLASVQHFLPGNYFGVMATDALFLLAAGAAGLAWLTGALRPRWHPFFWLLLFYFAAMALSTIFSEQPRHSLVKLAGETYLLALPVLAYQLLDGVADLRRAVAAWLAATALVVLTGLVAFVLFYTDRTSPLLQGLLYYNGSLPPGHYPRFQLTFFNANLLCNYLSVGIMLLLAAERTEMISRPWARACLALLLGCTLFTVSPGLGGVGLCLGLWGWILWRGAAPALARTALAGGIASAVLFVLATLVAFQFHATAPFAIHLFGHVFAPGPRVMTWMGSWRTFLDHPLFGRGVGLDACLVWYQPPAAPLGVLRDAHNVFLSVTAQEGIFGLAAILAILAFIARRTAPLRLDGDAAVFRVATGLALLGALAYQGLSGSFEDSRFLWLLMGLFLIALRAGETGPVPTASFSTNGRNNSANDGQDAGPESGSG